MADQPHKPGEEPNLIRFERTHTRPLFSGISRISDGKGQFLESLRSPAWGKLVLSGCLEKGLNSDERLVVIPIGGQFSSLDVVSNAVAATLSHTRLGLGNTVNNIKRATTNEMLDAPNHVAFPVNGVNDATGALHQEVTVLDALCASPIIQGMRTEAKNKSK